ncbi:serine/threonine-protein kinase pkga-related [Anaeramoeba flamelloides]|uniref:non-specific serine/threonine protein kinase n=1 Tax=Anaeramoeba flamelloides TaxID=1746091 RepID=A0AAV8A5T6_9EUKA|nr:serine/threonine-protein kinase pkga-related [Anaeramoeba flamelloides]
MNKKREMYGISSGVQVQNKKKLNSRSVSVDHKNSTKLLKEKILISVEDKFDFFNIHNSSIVNDSELTSSDELSSESFSNSFSDTDQRSEQENEENKKKKTKSAHCIVDQPKALVTQTNQFESNLMVQFGKVEKEVNPKQKPPREEEKKKEKKRETKTNRDDDYKRKKVTKIKFNRSSPQLPKLVTNKRETTQQAQKNQIVDKSIRDKSQKPQNKDNKKPKKKKKNKNKPNKKTKKKRNSIHKSRKIKSPFIYKTAHGQTIQTLLRIHKQFEERFKLEKSQIDHDLKKLALQISRSRKKIGSFSKIEKTKNTNKLKKLELVGGSKNPFKKSGFFGVKKYYKRCIELESNIKKMRKLTYKTISPRICLEYTSNAKSIFKNWEKDWPNRQFASTTVFLFSKLSRSAHQLQLSPKEYPFLIQQNPDWFLSRSRQNEQITNKQKLLNHRKLSVREKTITSVSRNSRNIKKVKKVAQKEEAQPQIDKETETETEIEKKIDNNTEQEQEQTQQQNQKQGIEMEKETDKEKVINGNLQRNNIQEETKNNQNRKKLNNKMHRLKKKATLNKRIVKGNFVKMTKNYEEDLKSNEDHKEKNRLLPFKNIILKITKRNINGGNNANKSEKTNQEISKSQQHKKSKIKCRLCHKLINADNLPQHSKFCQVTATATMLEMSCKKRLKNLIEEQENEFDFQKNTNNCKDHQSLFSHLKLIALGVRNLDIESPTAIEESSHYYNELKNLSFFQTSKPNEKIHLLGKKYLEEIYKLKNAFKQYKLASDKIKETVKPRLRRHKHSGSFNLPNLPAISDFTLIKHIASGGYGKVFLAEMNQTNDIYAIKILKKENMISKNQAQHIKSEKNIMLKNGNDFIVKLYYSFQSEKNLYIVMEFCPGGDLRSILQFLPNKCFNEQAVKSYLAEIVLALEFLHGQGIIHRDIKPGNILIDKDGHLKLTDFGLSKLGLSIRESTKNIKKKNTNPKLSGNDENSDYDDDGDNDDDDDECDNDNDNDDEDDDDDDDDDDGDDENENEKEKYNEKDNEDEKRNDYNSRTESEPESGVEISTFTDTDTDTDTDTSKEVDVYEDEGKRETGEETETTTEIDDEFEPKTENKTNNNTIQPKKDFLTQEKLSLNERDSNLEETPNKSINEIVSENDKHEFEKLSSMCTNTKNSKYQIIGTPGYLSPEIYLGERHSFEADWWSFGVLAYELVVGIPPWISNDEIEVMENMLSKKIDYPAELSELFVDLVSKLLTKNPKKRLGKNGANEIKKHPFFKDLDWENIKLQKPLFIPKLREPTDLKYFKHSKNHNESTILDIEILEDIKNATYDESLLFSKESNVFDTFSSINWDELHQINIRMAKAYRSSHLSSEDSIN